jgi:hypothetical protein
MILLMLVAILAVMLAAMWVVWDVFTGSATAEQRTQINVGCIGLWILVVAVSAVVHASHVIR